MPEYEHPFFVIGDWVRQVDIGITKDLGRRVYVGDPESYLHAHIHYGRITNINISENILYLEDCIPDKGVDFVPSKWFDLCTPDGVVIWENPYVGE